jgi:hypothetical protein
MRMSFSTCELLGDVEPMVGLALRLRALSAELLVCAAGLRGAAGPCRRAAGDRRHASRSAAMTEHAVVIAGGGRRNGDSAAMTRASIP